MAHDGKALARARSVLREKKLKNEAETSSRRVKLFSEISELRALDIEMTQLMSSVALTALKAGADAGAAVKNARNRSEEILSRRADILRKNGYPENYLDEIFACPNCHDTGYVVGKPCSCLETAYTEESVRLLSSMLNLGDQCFENFRTDFYEAIDGSQTTDAVRKIMADIYTACYNYAHNFDKNSVNLLFRGGTGLGKTFLSAGIAKVVSEKGFSVVYDTSVALMEAFETQKFDRDAENSTAVSSQVKRYLNCDLLILDDLGTELCTSFTQSALYTLINTRLVRGGKTIISTNLSEDDLSRRYTPQIASRLRGEYIMLNFIGRDIRIIKRAKM